MSLRTTGKLLVAVIVTGAAILLMERAARNEAASRPENRLVTGMPRQVTWLTIHGPTGVVECVRRADAWQLQRPVRGRADAGRVRWLLDTIEDLQRVEVITPIEMKSRDLKLPDYGLAEGCTRLAFGDLNSRRELLMGHRTPLGDLVYVKLAAEPDVVATSDRLLAALPGSVDALRDRLVLHGDPARVTRLEIQRPAQGFIRLGRDAKRAWTMQQPVPARADGARVDVMVEGLFTAQVKRFIWDPPPAPPAGAGDAAAPEPRTEPYQLAPDTAAARIGVWFTGDDAGRGLVLGKEAADVPGEIYARLSDAPGVFTVSRSVLDLFAVSSLDIRDRAVFMADPANVRRLSLREGDAKISMERTDRGWMLVEPLQWPADPVVVDAVLRQMARLRVESFVAETAPDPLPFGLQSPARLLAWSTARPTNAAPAGVAGTREALLLGDAATNAAVFYGACEGMRTVFTVSAGAVRDLGVFPPDPLQFYERTVLNVPSETVRRITLVSQGRTQMVARAADGSWAPGPEQKGACDARAIDDLLAQAARLRAARIECRAPPDLAPYGLDAPPLTLTLGLSGGEGIEKTLMIGFRAKTAGAYARVLGHELVFVLGVDVVEQLSRDILQPPVLPGQAAP